MPMIVVSHGYIRTVFTVEYFSNSKEETIVSFACHSHVLSFIFGSYVCTLVPVS